MRKNFKILLAWSIIFLCISQGEASIQVSEERLKAINDEAENWIDDMPEGLQDRLSDAVAHSLRNSPQELQYYRNRTASDTTLSETLIIRERVTDDGLRYRLYIAKEKENEQQPALVYFHGGGWSVGSLNVVESFCRALAESGVAKVISLDYPQAPESSPLNVIMKSSNALKELIAEAENLGINKERISVGGDGAGGNVALSVFFSLQTGRDAMPFNSIVLYYPLLTVEPDESSQSWKSYGKGYGLDRRLMEQFLLAYAGANPEEISPDLPVSPGNLPDEALKKMPPTLIITAGRDIVVDEGRKFATLLKDLGVSIEYVEFPGAIHGFITDGHQKTAFQTALQLTEEFLKQ